ncbi:hypothetical protein D6C97_04303 [Aureobasidium pullulans]|nr:hypothetical protein D6C97_04303 [Aureobasidium pullulans]
MSATNNTRPPSYLSHEEQASAPAYTEVYTPPTLPPASPRPADWPDQYGNRAPASRTLPPSRPLQRPDRLELNNRSSRRSNIRIASPTPSWPAEEMATNNSVDDDCKTCSVYALVVLLAAVFASIVSSAVFVKRDSVALHQNSNILKDLTSTVLTLRETKTSWDTKAWNTKTVTEEGTKTVTVTETAVGDFNAKLTSVVTGMDDFDVEIHTMVGERLRKREKTIGDEYVDENLCTTTTFFPWGRWQQTPSGTVRVCCPPTETPEPDLEERVLRR